MPRRAKRGARQGVANGSSPIGTRSARRGPPPPSPQRELKPTKVFPQLRPSYAPASRERWKKSKGLTQQQQQRREACLRGCEGCEGSEWVRGEAKKKECACASVHHSFIYMCYKYSPCRKANREANGIKGREKMLWPKSNQSNLCRLCKYGNVCLIKKLKHFTFLVLLVFVPSLIRSLIESHNHG